MNKDNIIKAFYVVAILLLIAGLVTSIVALARMGESTDVPPGTSREEKNRIQDEYMAKQKVLLENGGWVLLSCAITFVITYLSDKYII